MTRLLSWLFPSLPVRAPEPVAVTREELARVLLDHIGTGPQTMATALLSKFTITQKVSHEST